MDDNPLGKIIAEQSQRVLHEQRVAWEVVMRLHVKPRPRWCPMWAWRVVVRNVIFQSEQQRVP